MVSIFQSESREVKSIKYHGSPFPVLDRFVPKMYRAGVGK